MNIIFILFYLLWLHQVQAPASLLCIVRYRDPVVQIVTGLGLHYDSHTVPVPGLKSFTSAFVGYGQIFAIY